MLGVTLASQLGKLVLERGWSVRKAAIFLTVTRNASRLVGEFADAGDCATVPVRQTTCFIVF